MKIVEQSTTYLKLQYLTVATIWKMGGYLVALGMLLLLGLGKITYLSCKRTQPEQATCSLMEVGLLPKYNQFGIRPLIQGDTIDNQFVRLFNNGNHLVFIPDQSENPVLSHFLAYPWNQVIYDTSPLIGEFFSNSNQSLKTLIRNDKGRTFQIIGGGFIFLGVLCWKLKQAETCILDKESNELTYTRQGILSLPNIQKLPLDQVKVLVEQGKNHDDEITYTLVLQVPENQRIILIGGTSTAADRLAREISSFLGVETIEVPEK